MSMGTGNWESTQNAATQREDSLNVLLYLRTLVIFTFVFASWWPFYNKQCLTPASRSWLWLFLWVVSFDACIFVHAVSLMWCKRIRYLLYSCIWGCRPYLGWKKGVELGILIQDVLRTHDWSKSLAVRHSCYCPAHFTFLTIRNYEP